MAHERATVITRSVGVLAVLCASFVASVMGQTQSTPASRGVPGENTTPAKESSVPQNPAAPRTPAPPCQQNRDPGPDGALAGGARPTNLGDYLNGLKAIVQAEVQSVEDGPVMGRGAGGGPDRRVVVNTLKVTNTLKSATPLERVTAINLNFGGSFAMKPGQRYILFLSEYTATGAQMVEERAGAPRFRAGAALCVEDTDRVYSSTRGSIGVGNRVMLSPLLGPLDGLTLDKALVEIRSALGTAPAK